MKIDLNFNEDVEPEQTFEKKDVYFSSPTDISKKGQRSQLYLIPENPDQEPQDQNEDGAQKNNINLMSSQPEKEEIGESSDEGEKHATNADLKRNSIQIKSEDEFSLKNQDESKEKRKNDDKKIQREDSPHKEISSTHDINSNKVDTAKKNIHEPKKESSVLQVPTKYEEDYQNIDDSKFEEHHVDVKNDFKGVELPKKLPPKQSTSQQPSVKKQLFKARPKFINFTETKQEKTDLVGFDNTEQMPSESHQPIDDDGEDKNENTVNKMHANLITSDDSPKDHQGSARKKSSDDNIDIDIGWGFPQKKDTIEDNEDEEIEHIQSPDFGMSAKTRKIHLEKRLTFGEKELREATEEKDSEAKPEVSKTELTGKRLFGKPTLKPSLPTDEIKKEESSDRIQSSTLRSETDSKLVSSPEQQNSPKKGEKKPLKKIFKQTKLVKKT